MVVVPGRCRWLSSGTVPWPCPRGSGTSERAKTPLGLCNGALGGVGEGSFALRVTEHEENVLKFGFLPDNCEGVTPHLGNREEFGEMPRTRSRPALGRLYCPSLSVVVSAEGVGPGEPFQPGTEQILLRNAADLGGQRPLMLPFFRGLFISVLNPVVLEMPLLQTRPAGAGRVGSETPRWETLPPRWGIWGCAVPDPGCPGVRALPHIPVSHLLPPKPWFGREGRVILRPRGVMFSLGHSARNPRLPVSHVTLSPLSHRHIPLSPSRGR